MFRRGLLAFLGLSLALPAAGPACARDLPELSEGTRVRISAPPLGLYGEAGTVDLSGRRGLVVVLDDGERVAVPYPAVARIDVSRGKRRATAQGALAGALFGIAMVVTASEPTYEEWAESGDTGLNGGELILGAMVGGAFGAVIGSAITYETWRPVPWIRFAGPDGDYGAGVGFETRFDPAD